MALAIDVENMAMLQVLNWNVNLRCFQPPRSPSKYMESCGLTWLIAQLVIQKSETPQFPWCPFYIWAGLTAALGTQKGTAGM